MRKYNIINENMNMVNNVSKSINSIGKKDINRKIMNDINGPKGERGEVDIDHEIQQIEDMWEDNMNMRENEIVLVDSVTERILAWVKEDTFGIYTIITSGDQCYSLVESSCLNKTNPKETRYEFARHVVEFNNKGYSNFEDAMKFINNIFLNIDIINMNLKALTIQEEDYCTDDLLYHEDRLSAIVYCLDAEEDVAVASIDIVKVDSINYMVTTGVFERTINELKSQGVISKDYNIKSALGQIDTNCINSLEDAIDELNDSGFYVAVHCDDEQVVFLYPGEWQELGGDGDYEDGNNDNKKGDDCMNGFVITRSDKKDIPVLAYISNDENRPYDFFINDIYLVNRRFILNDDEINEFKNVVKENENKSLYDMVSSLNKLKMFSDDGSKLVIEPMNGLENLFVKPFVNAVILGIHKESKDTVMSIKFNKLNEVFHGDGKYAIAKTMIATDNVSAADVKPLRKGYDLYTGVTSGEDKLVDVVYALSDATDEFEFIIEIDGVVLYMNFAITKPDERNGMGDALSNLFEGTFGLGGLTPSMYGMGGLHTGKIINAPFGSNNNESAVKENKANKKKITFDDVVGMTEVKEKLYDVIDQINNKEKYEEWNIQPIRGILLHGPSGTGKSYISEALANEVNAKFIKKSAGDIVSKYIGESGQNIKKIFDEARSYNGNSIIFMDEIDAIASKRSGEDNNKERNSTLNELLVQMSSPDNDNVFMIFATNLVEILDPAFLRSGRCDFKIEVPLPDYEMRKGILESTSKGRPLAEGLDFARIARNMSGMNCADVAHISNEAARTALKAKKSCVEEEDYDKAYEVMACGSSSKTTKLSEQEKRITATHEIGHFFMNYKLDLRKAKKISILPRGSALGFVLYANDKEDDKFISTKEELKGRIMTLLAGRAIEEVMLGFCGTGASNDLEVANEVARNIVCKYAFNGSLLVYDNNDIMSRPLINKQVSEILDECYADVKAELNNNKELLTELIEYLYNKEDVTGDELIGVINAFDKKVTVQ